MLNVPITPRRHLAYRVAPFGDQWQVVAHHPWSKWRDDDAEIGALIGPICTCDDDQMALLIADAMNFFGRGKTR